MSWSSRRVLPGKPGGSGRCRVSFRRLLLEPLEGRLLLSFAQQATLTVPPAGGTFDNAFNPSMVAIDGDTVVVGSPNNFEDSSGYPTSNALGEVYVYTKPAAGWADMTQPTAILTPSDGARAMPSAFP